MHADFWEVVLTLCAVAAAIGYASGGHFPWGRRYSMLNTLTQAALLLGLAWCMT